MEEKNEISNVFIVFGAATLIFCAASLAYLLDKLHFIWFKPIIFFYMLSVIIIIFRIYLYKKISGLAKSMKFHFVTSIFHQPKIEGMYKGHYFQLHYRSKDYGKFGGMLRTYVKLIYKAPKKFDEAALQKCSGNHNGCDIIVAKHIVRPEKNYLLMKVSTYIFDKKKLFELMDYLISISTMCEKKA
ncbi:MAG: hypothetical protein V1859_04465 [archaeon]